MITDSNKPYKNFCILEALLQNFPREMYKTQNLASSQVQAFRPQATAEKGSRFPVTTFLLSLPPLINRQCLPDSVKPVIDAL